MQAPGVLSSNSPGGLSTMTMVIGGIVALASAVILRLFLVRRAKAAIVAEFPSDIAVTVEGDPISAAYALPFWTSPTQLTVYQLEHAPQCPQGTAWAQSQNLHYQGSTLPTPRPQDPAAGNFGCFFIPNQADAQFLTGPPACPPGFKQEGQACRPHDSAIA